jgi:hypothetical protein
MNGCLVAEALLHPFVRDHASAASTALASETGGQDYHCTVIPFKSDRGENAYGLRYSRTACTLVILTADYNNAAVFSIIALQHDSLVGNTVLIRTWVLTLSPRDLVDQYLPAYESYMRGSGDAWTGDPGGRAEGIMCAYSDLALTNDTTQRVPSCANEYLLKDVLRDQFQSPSLVQSDCCDSVSDIYVGHNFTASLEDAIALATKAGTQILFGGNVTTSRAAMKAAISDGKVSKAQLQENVARALLTRFRLGEFDDSHPHGDVDGEELIPLLDSPAHRAIARRTAAESCVLLKNSEETLPLAATGAGAPKTIAVVGPFIDDGEALLHSYNGRPSSIITPLAAITSAFSGSQVRYAEGVHNSVGGGGGRHPAGSDGNISAAVQLAADADLTIAVLGLGSRVEFEAVDRGEGPGDCPGTAISFHFATMENDDNMPRQARDTQGNDLLTKGSVPLLPAARHLRRHQQPHKFRSACHECVPRMSALISRRTNISIPRSRTVSSDLRLRLWPEPD